MKGLYIKHEPTIVIAFSVLLCVILGLVGFFPERKGDRRIEKMNVDDRGLISVTYTENGERWASDYMEPVDFHAKFNIIVTNYKSTK